jgi:transcriptional regulator with XRE-family HTH domain
MSNLHHLDDLIPKRLREERLARGWTLDQLAARSAVSRAMISKIERGQSSPTAALLARLASAMGLSLSSLMSERGAAAPAMRQVRDQPVWIDPQTGYARRLVSPNGGEGDVEIVAIELPAGAAVEFDEAENLRSDEQVLMLEGRLMLQTGEAQFDLLPGDCARFSADLAHKFVNTGDAVARYLVVRRQQPGL